MRKNNVKIMLFRFIFVIFVVNETHAGKLVKIRKHFQMIIAKINPGRV